MSNLPLPNYPTPNRWFLIIFCCLLTTDITITQGCRQLYASFEPIPLAVFGSPVSVEAGRQQETLPAAGYHINIILVCYSILKSEPDQGTNIEHSLKDQDTGNTHSMSLHCLLLSFQTSLRVLPKRDQNLQLQRGKICWMFDPSCWMFDPSLKICCFSFSSWILNAFAVS